ncbi:hypothetical protein GCM10010365_76220 [Streptomyces poonensis]|uniref:Uncharacterized protein n=1 Tax=Streptomyces poonensis TaxID=68255 RepID=A0A918UZ95_9ACTN|nr:hypothetical protein GCM10010365_76220 [Streptomyces poonensis]GLJ93541.1 hypothetical protein GCM10017589_61550 [Streptomyces poonensis]
MYPLLDRPQGGEPVQGVGGEFEAQPQRAFDDNLPVKQVLVPHDAHLVAGGDPPIGADSASS